jgi:hypothetical protein
MPDQLSALCGEFLDGGYGCGDQVILNAYISFPSASPGQVFARYSCGIARSIHAPELRVGFRPGDGN